LKLEIKNSSRRTSVVPDKLAGFKHKSTKQEKQFFLKTSSKSAVINTYNISNNKIITTTHNIEDNEPI